MASWIRFRFANGDCAMINGEHAYFVFKTEEHQIEVYAAQSQPGADRMSAPLCIYPCEYPDQVSAAEELIFDALNQEQSLVLTLEYLDERAEYFNNINGLRMVLQLLHQGTLRIPMEDGLSDSEMFDKDTPPQRSEISQFEEMLHTYLEVPDDSLRRSIVEQVRDAPFSLSRDHDECPEHGYHQYWIVETRPDHSYSFRRKYDELVKSLMEKEGFSWQSGSHA